MTPRLVLGPALELAGWCVVAALFVAGVLLVALSRRPGRPGTK